MKICYPALPVYKPAINGFNSFRVKTEILGGSSFLYLYGIGFGGLAFSSFGEKKQ